MLTIKKKYEQRSEYFTSSAAVSAENLCWQLTGRVIFRGGLYCSLILTATPSMYEKAVNDQNTFWCLPQLDTSV